MSYITFRLVVISAPLQFSILGPVAAVALKSSKYALP